MIIKSAPPNQSLKLTLRTRRRLLTQVSTDLKTTYHTKQHFHINRAPRPQKHSQRSLVPVRYPALLAKSVFKSDSIVVVGKNSLSIK